LRGLSCASRRFELWAVDLYPVQIRQTIRNTPSQLLSSTALLSSRPCLPRHLHLQRQPTTVITTMPIPTDRAMFMSMTTIMVMIHGQVKNTSLVQACKSGRLHSPHTNHSPSLPIAVTLSRGSPQSNDYDTLTDPKLATGKKQPLSRTTPSYTLSTQPV